jgi:hypothetical protein
MNTKLFSFLLLFLLLEYRLTAQSSESILIITDATSKIIVDGAEIGQSESGKPLRVATSSGEHYVQAISIINGKSIEKNEVVTVEQSKQKVVKLSFAQTDTPLPSPSSAEMLSVVNLNVVIPGTLTVSNWKNEHPNQKYPCPEYFYAFEKGDEIVIDLTMTNKSGTNVINISTYPDGIEKYTNNSFTELTALKIKVEKRSIYRFAFASNFAFDRNGLLKISRVPSSSSLSDFNTNVVKAKLYTPVLIQESESHFVNSGSNATFGSGKSRIIIPVELPANTTHWFYRFSAYRSADEIEKVKSKFNLFSELTTLALNFTAGPEVGKAAGIAVDQLSQPPGADYCHIYLIDYNSVSPFEAKSDGNWKYFIEGSRENLKSGNVRVTE